MQFSCPTCAKELTVGTLKELQAHVKKCGKKVNPLKLSSSVRNSLLPDAKLLPELPFEIWLSHKIESQNAAHKQHWTVHNRSVAAWRGVLEPKLASLMGLDLTWSRWSFLRLIPAGGREYDYANLVGGGKAMVDALTHFKVIHDDGPKYFKGDYAQEKQSERYADLGVQTIITLHEATR